MAVLAEGAEAQVAAARVRDARASVLARIVVAHGDLASGSNVARGTLALPITVLRVRLGVRGLAAVHD